MDALVEHADRCAAKIEEKPPPAPRLPPAPKSRGGERKRPAIPTSAVAGERKRRSAPSLREKPFHQRRRPSVAALSAPAEERDPTFVIELVQVDEFEFRCQDIQAQSGARPVADKLSASVSPRGSEPACAPAAASSRAARERSASGRARGSVTAAARTIGVAGTTVPSDVPQVAVAPAPAAAVASVPVSGMPAGHSGLGSARLSPEEVALERDAEQFLTMAREILGSGSSLQTLGQLLVSFQDGVVDTVEVMEKAASLLGAHEELMYRFNRFLPEGYRIETLPPPLGAYSVCFDTAMPSVAQARALAENFFGRVERSFESEPAKLIHLHAILTSVPAAEVLAQPKPAPGSASQLCELLAPFVSCEPDLAHEFLQFVPPSCCATGHVHTVVAPGLPAELPTAVC